MSAIFIVAVAVSYAWELAQSPLYQGTTSLAAMWWHCFRASVGDGVLVLLIYAAAWAATGRDDWYERRCLRGYLVAAVTGFVVAVAVEWIALRVGRWNYSAHMPLMPGLRVGIIPLAQMMLLPPLVFRVVGKRRRRCTGRGRS